MLDRRLNAFRPDLADERLRDRVEAARFVSGERAQVVMPVLPVYRGPDEASLRETEALHGETVRVFERTGGWAWVQLESDGYVGYVAETGIAAGVSPATHRVAALGTYLYARPDIKSPVLARLPMNASLGIADIGPQLSRTADGAFIATRHIAPIGQHEPDYVAVAERYLGVPYLWGGRSSAGLDCSGLVQMALMAAGLACPRDTDMQQRELGGAIALDRPPDRLQRGDLMFWKGHVAIVTAPGQMLHANAHHMQVAAEPIAPALARIAIAGSTLEALRRMGRLVADRDAV
jgi:cell wall-associated NlpC family hydrolase